MDNNFGCRETACIQTDKIYDSCKDKECLENLRVYFCGKDQCLIDRAINVKCRKSEILWVYTDVEPVPFKRGFYTVDIKFFFEITLDVFTNVGPPVSVKGLATYDKKVVLFGSEGNAKIYSSEFKEGKIDPQLMKSNNLPRSIVEVVEPICLNAKVVDATDCCCSCECECDFASIPSSIQELFNNELLPDGEQRRVYVTIGLFSIIKLVRKVQLLIPVIDFCIPDKECVSSTDADPCDLFEKLSFPVDEFYPPLVGSFKDDDDFGCGCNK
jgi:hypothetical protein